MKHSPNETADQSHKSSERALADCIIARAKQFKQMSTSTPTYSDYEYYKRMLYNSGLYGYESELADALGL